MKSDLEILNAIAEELKSVDHPRFAQNMIDFYEHLVSRVPEDGFNQILDDNELSVEQETAILQLQRYGYLERTIQGISRGRVEYYVNLRGKRFLELANNQVHSVVVGMQDSGQRETFETGAVRDTADGKPRFDLFSPFAMERVGLWLMRGAAKYSEHNWSKGIPASRCLASLHRHLMKYMQGATDEDHLSAIATNCMFLLHFEEAVKRGFLPESLLDLPKYEPIPNVHRNKDVPLEHEPDEEFRWRAIHK